MSTPFAARRKGSGLTLVEVLVACTLGLVVLTLMVQSLIPTMLASRKAADRVDLHQRATLLGERIATDLRQSARSAVGVFPSSGRLQVSVHPRQTDSGTVAWQNLLRVYDWSQSNQRVTGSIAPLDPPPQRAFVPATAAVLDALSLQPTLQVEGVREFTFALDSGPFARLTMTLAKGDQTLPFSRLVFFRNGTE